MPLNFLLKRCSLMQIYEIKTRIEEIGKRCMSVEERSEIKKRYEEGDLSLVWLLLRDNQWNAAALFSSQLKIATLFFASINCYSNRLLFNYFQRFFFLCFNKAQYFLGCSFRCKQPKILHYFYDVSMQFIKFRKKRF